MESGKSSHGQWGAGGVGAPAREEGPVRAPSLRRSRLETALLVLALAAVAGGVSAIVVVEYPDRRAPLLAAAWVTAGALTECLLLLRRWGIAAAEAAPGPAGPDRQDTAHRLELASAVAAQAELQTRTLELLNDAVSAMSGVLEPRTLDRILCQRASDLLGGVETLLVRRVREDGGITVVAREGSPPCDLAPDAGNPVSRTFESGQPLLWVEGASSVASVPLGLGTPPSGVLVACAAENRRLGEGDLRILALLAGQAAPAIEAARLHAELVAAHSDLTRTNEELALASHHKSDFLASVSHEVRTPLNSILGFSELLLDSDVADPARRTAFLRNIHRSGLVLLALINDILDLAKVEAGGMQLRGAEIDLAGTIAAAVATMAPLADQDGIVLIVDSPPSLLLWADDDKVQQMLFNLLANAITFTPRDGRVTVRAWQEEERVLICVADTGVGIAKEDQERIFEEFQQLEVGRQPRRPGTGLGLTLTRRLVELHGGRIRVESEPGAGSRFVVELPRSGSSGPAASETRWPLSS
jgi:signal transduction histidine kinase